MTAEIERKNHRTQRKMTLIDMLVVVGLCAASFFAGMRTSDRYHDEEAKRVTYEVRLAQARMKAGDFAPYIAPPQKKKRMPIGQPFLDKLKTNGRATQQISKSKQIS